MKRLLGVVLAGVGLTALGCAELGGWSAFFGGVASLGAGVALARLPRRPWTFRDEALHRMLVASRGLR